MTSNGGITCGSVTVHGPLEGDGLDAMVNGLAHLRDALREAILAPHRVAL